MDERVASYSGFGGFEPGAIIENDRKLFSTKHNYRVAILPEILKRNNQDYSVIKEKISALNLKIYLEFQKQEPNIWEERKKYLSRKSYENTDTDSIGFSCYLSAIKKQTRSKAEEKLIAQRDANSIILSEALEENQKKENLAFDYADSLTEEDAPKFLLVIKNEFNPSYYEEPSAFEGDRWITVKAYSG